MNQRKALVILTPGFPENEDDSSCLPAQQQFVRALNECFPHLRIIIVSFQYPFYSGRYEWHGNPVIALNGRNRPRLHRARILVKAWNLLKLVKKKHEIIGLFSFWCTECAFVARYFGKKYGLKQFAWILGQDAVKSNKWIRWIRPDAENLVAMSGFLSAEFRKQHGILPAHIISNGIDPSLYPVPNGSRDIDILGVGSLIPLKRYDLFIAIIAELQRSFPAIQCMICGQGAEEDHLIELIRRYKLENNIILAGACPHAEVLRWMSRSRLFLHTSSYEGFSTVCLEALYSGAHVVSFIDPQMGRIRNWHVVSDREQLMDCVVKLLNDRDLDHTRVFPYSMQESARQLMRLFSYREEAIS